MNLYGRISLLFCYFKEHSKGANIAWNWIIQIGGRVLSTILVIIITAFIARRLGPTLFGQYSFALTLSGLWAGISEFGVNSLAAREVARHRDQENAIIAAVTEIRFILAIICTLFLILMVFLLPGDIEQKRLTLIAGLWIPISVFSISQIVFQTRFQMHIVTIGSIITTVINFGCVLLLLFPINNISPRYLVIVYLISLSFGFMFTSLLAFRVVKPDWQGAKKYLMPIFYKSIPIGLGVLLVTAYVRIDTILIETTIGIAAVGIYNAAYRFVDGLSFLPISFMRVIFPTISEAFYYDNEKLKTTYQQAMDVMCFIAIPLAVGGWLYSIPFARLVFPDYAGLGQVLQLLLVSAAIAFISNVVGTMMLAIDQQKATLAINFGGLVINTLLNIILLPKYGIIAAAYVTIITEIFVCGTSYFIVGFTLKYHVNLKIIVISIISGVFMIGIAKLVELRQIGNGYNWILAGIVGTSFYIVTFLFFKNIKGMFIDRNRPSS